MFDRIMNRIILNVLIRKGQKALKQLEADSHHAHKMSEELLMQLVRENENTEYGRKCHFSEIHSVDDYKRLVPFTSYSDYFTYIDRMIRKNEKNLISSRDAVHYALTSGSVGVPKHIPVSQETMEIYGNYAAKRVFASAENYHRKKYGKGFPRGRGLNLMEIRLSRTENGVPRGAISGGAMNSQRQYLKYIFTSPEQVLFPQESMDMKYLKIRYAMEDKNIVFIVSAFMTAVVDLMNYMMDNWQLLCDDIEKGTIARDIKMPENVRAELEKDLKPNRKRAEELRQVFAQGFETPIIPRVWPRMSWIAAIGTGGFVTYTEKMRELAGDRIFIDFMNYAASESLMGVTKAAEEMKYSLLPGACYFEFIPADSDDDRTTYGIGELEVGKNYEVVLTNLSGFYRYKIQDVINVKSYYNEIPEVAFVYRKSQMISIAGEKTNSESVDWAVAQFSDRIGCRIMDYAIYADKKTAPGRYVMLIEPDHPLDLIKLPEYRDIMDEKLGYANPSYGSKVREGILAPLDLRVSMIQTHAAYRDLMIRKGISENQLKPVRVLDSPRKEKFFLTMVEGAETPPYINKES